MDADDLVAPEMAEVCARMLDADPGISLVYTEREEFGDVVAVWEAGEFELERLKYFNQFSYCTLYRKAMWQAIGAYRTNVNGFDDWDFWIAAAALGFRGLHRPGPLLEHRKRGDSQIRDCLAITSGFHNNHPQQRDLFSGGSRSRGGAAGDREGQPAVPLRPLRLHGPFPRQAAGLGSA